MRLLEAAVDRYGPLTACRPPCDEGLTVLSGPNEAGKTLYLEAVLRLLDPGVATVLDPPPRIEDPPTGRVVVETNGEQYDCTGSTALSEFSAIEPRHLGSVFVVRDNDLALPGSQDYYTSLVETLGEVHTAEIEAITSELKDLGRLTDKRLNVSSNEAHDNAGTVRDEAQELAGEIRDYVETVESDSLDDLDARRLRLKRSLRSTREELETQETAKTVTEYERLSESLDAFRTTTERLADLEGFDRATLHRLRERRNDLERDRDGLADVETRIEETNAEIETLESELDDLKSRKTTLDRGQADVDAARDALESYRDRRDQAGGSERQRTLATYATVAALLAAGGAGTAGALSGSLPAIGLGALLFLVAVGSGLAATQANRRLAAIDTARDAAVQAAREAGLDVDAVGEVTPAIESFESDLAELDARITRTAERYSNAEADLAELRQRRSELAEAIDSIERTIEEAVDEVGVDSIDAYASAVERLEDLETDRELAERSLVDRFGKPDAESPEAKASAWEAALADLVSDVAVAAVDPETYDESELADLAHEADRLTEELEALQADLEAHDDTLDEFDERARRLDSQPFINRRLALASRTTGGLESLADDLERLVDRIEADAELSRKALAIFERIEAREEQKLSALFAPDGPASRTFERLTGDRYGEVAYDADSHDLVVTRLDGRTLGPAQLSQATTDQLYFASRVSLASQLLGNEPGFLLLDDPFLAADPDRLRLGFETLMDLAEEGWQIRYCTAKGEVAETMVAEFDLPHERIDAVP